MCRVNCSREQNKKSRKGGGSGNGGGRGHRSDPRGVETEKNRKKRRCDRGWDSSGDWWSPPCIKAFFCRRLVQSFSSNDAVACDYLRGSSSSFWRSFAERCPAERKRIPYQNAVACHHDFLHPGTFFDISVFTIFLVIWKNLYFTLVI